LTTVFAVPVFVAAAACGTPPSAQAPRFDAPPTSTSNGSAAAGSTAGSAAAAGGTSGDGHGSGTIAAQGSLAGRTIVPTQLGSELSALGLDAHALPPLDKVEGDKLRKVMKLFNRSLGVKCNFCHADDYAAPTAKKRVAERMWDEFARGLQMTDGSAVFCDTCHQGKAEFLDHGDNKALGHWMEEHFSAKLALRPSGARPSMPAGPSHSSAVPMAAPSASAGPHAELACAACHGEPFEGDIVKFWAQGKPVPGKRR
jgi:hypothetical protein